MAGLILHGSWCLPRKSYADPPRVGVCVCVSMRQSISLSLSLCLCVCVFSSEVEELRSDAAFLVSSCTSGLGNMSAASVFTVLQAEWALTNFDDKMTNVATFVLGDCSFGGEDSGVLET